MMGKLLGTKHLSTGGRRRRPTVVIIVITFDGPGTGQFQRNPPGVRAQLSTATEGIMDKLDRSQEATEFN